MRVRVIAVGTRMPAWVDSLFTDYTRRLGHAVPVTLKELAIGQRGGRAKASEGQRMLAELRREEFVVALDEHGEQLSTRELASWLAARQRDGRDLAFLIGGPDGLAPEVLARSDFTWSLSKLTLPHALARVFVAEQLYRAHTLLSGHPYHRE
ncbi:MAG TPA: 23S rRNA (pseudouridine(1915)-N(3))-methyltransferase RlmH [Steroidobacteraceae bacterium]|nr:23S rRNA (pseudouridine(1915)-N(3))-methyltransferase RlmH [Steroidobacteraceae bacterium]